MTVGYVTTSAILLASLFVSLVAIPVSAQTLTADYEVVFDATWSALTHPVDFPGNPHFSSLIGGTHDANVAFWGPGELASLGIERMAETGNTTNLSNEVNVEISAGFADQVILGSGTGSPGTVSVSFTADQDYPLLTLVSMLAPSPDWFVGVHDLPLFDQGWWVTERIVNLYTYDSGTDLGVTFESDDEDANPQLPIELQGFPLEVGVPVGTFTIRRLPEPGFAMQLALSLPFLAWIGRARQR